MNVLNKILRSLVDGKCDSEFIGSLDTPVVNTGFPIDRLDELAAQGTIGSVADEHLAYAGNQFDLSAIRMDSGPAGAKFLKEQDVDVVLLTPV